MFEATLVSRILYTFVSNRPADYDSSSKRVQSIGCTSQGFYIHTKFFFMGKLSVSYLFLSVGLLLVLTQCQNQPAPSLSGKSYQVTLVDPSNATSVEKLVFTGDTFEGVDCRKYGFGSAPCAFKKENDGTTFESTTHSTTEDQMIWKGIVKGNVIEGSVVWKKEGQADIAYSFKGVSL